MRAPTRQELTKIAKRRDKAFATQKRLAADRERVLGPDHPDTLTARVKLQELYHLERLTVLGLTIQEEEQLVADCERVLGPDHPATLTIRAYLQDFRSGRLDDEGLTIQEEEQLVADCERVLGPDHPATLTIRANLAARTAPPTPLLYWDPSWQ